MLAQAIKSFLAALTPVSASAAVLARSLQVDWSGAGQISFPGLTLPAAAFVGEGAPIAVQDGTSSAGVTISPYKLAVIITLTNEMLAGGPAEAMVRQTLIENVGPTLDNVLFSTTAGSTARPAGLLNGISAIGAATKAGTILDTMTLDIQALAKALAPVGSSGMVIVAAPAQAVALSTQLMHDPIPVLSSNALADRSIIGLVPTALATAIDVPRIELVDQTTLHMESVALELVGSPGTIAAPSRSLFQTDSQAIRFILPCSWALRSSSALAYITGTNW
jgi:hypothetical protein